MLSAPNEDDYDPLFVNEGEAVDPPPSTGWDWIEQTTEAPPPPTGVPTNFDSGTPVIGKFKAIPTERLDAIRLDHINRAKKIGIKTPGKSYYEIVGELLDYIEGVRAILNHGYRVKSRANEKRN